MARAILIDLSKLVDNFDEVHQQVEDAGTETIIKVHNKGKILKLVRDGRKGRRKIKK